LETTVEDVDDGVLIAGNRLRSVFVTEWDNDLGLFFAGTRRAGESTRGAEDWDETRGEAEACSDDGNDETEGFWDNAVAEFGTEETSRRGKEHKEWAATSELLLAVVVVVNEVVVGVGVGAVDTDKDDDSVEGREWSWLWEDEDDDGRTGGTLQIGGSASGPNSSRTFVS